MSISEGRRLRSAPFLLYASIHENSPRLSCGPLVCDGDLYGVPWVRNWLDYRWTRAGFPHCGVAAHNLLCAAHVFALAVRAVSAASHCVGVPSASTPRNSAPVTRRGFLTHNIRGPVDGSKLRRARALVISLGSRLEAVAAFGFRVAAALMLGGMRWGNWIGLGNLACHFVAGFCDYAAATKLLSSACSPRQLVANLEENSHEETRFRCCCCRPRRRFCIACARGH